MHKYFSVDDYTAIDDDARAIIDKWLHDNGMMNAMVTLVEQREDGTIALSGPIVDSNNFSSESENEIKARLEDTFPWEVVENSLMKVAKSQEA